MLGKLKQLMGTIISYTKYPQPIIWFVNNGPFSTSFNIDSTAEIARGCEVRGDLSLASHARVGPGSTLKGDIDIGEGSNLVKNVRAVGNINIGSYCAVANDTLSQQIDHPTKHPAMQRRLYNQLIDTTLGNADNAPICIGSDVWIGTESIILGGVTVGHGAIIGAGAIVTNDVEPYSIMAGVPAEQKGWRFPKDVRERLLEVRWWEWTRDEIRDNSEFFTAEIRTVEDIDRTLER